MTDPYIKQDLVSHQRYNGEIKRSYTSQQRFSVTQKGERPMVIYSKKTLAQLEQKYPNAVVKEIR
jgi:hypothetical protein